MTSFIRGDEVELVPLLSDRQALMGVDTDGVPTAQRRQWEHSFLLHRVEGARWIVADAEGVLASSTHSGFPVVRDDGTLCGLLLRDELVHFDADAPLGAIMDRSPVVVHSGWPLSRAHRLFAALGLRHLVVVDPRAGGTPVGIVTRHDLCERCNNDWQRADATPTATLSRAHASAAEATEGRSSSAELRRARESELGTTRTVGAARC